MKVVLFLLLLFSLKAYGEEFCEMWDFQKGDNNKASIFIRALGCVTPDSYFTHAGEASAYVRMEGHLLSTQLSIVDVDVRSNSNYTDLNVLSLGQVIYSKQGAPAVVEESKVFRFFSLKKEWATPLPLGGIPFMVGAGVRGGIYGLAKFRGQLVPSPTQFVAQVSPTAYMSTYAFAGVGISPVSFRLKADLVLLDSTLNIGGGAGFYPVRDMYGGGYWVFDGEVYGRHRTQYLKGRLGLELDLVGVRLPFILAHYAGQMAKKEIFNKKYQKKFSEN